MSQARSILLVKSDDDDDDDDDELPGKSTLEARTLAQLEDFLAGSIRKVGTENSPQAHRHNAEGILPASYR